MPLKECKNCLLFKRLDNFHICKIVGDKKYYRRKCKVCYRAEQQKLRDSGYYKEYYHNNTKKYNKYYEDNKSSNTFMERRRATTEKYRLENKQDIKHKAKFRERKRRKNPVYRLRSNISRSVREALTKVSSSKGYRSFFQHIDYTLEELKLYLESYFEPWMSWDNYGMFKNNEWDDSDKSTWKWNIDHIIPQSKLPYDCMDHINFKKCWSLDNLRPMNAKLNLLKSNN